MEMILTRLSSTIQVHLSSLSFEASRQNAKGWPNHDMAEKGRGRGRSDWDPWLRYAWMPRGVQHCFC